MYNNLITNISDNLNSENIAARISARLKDPRSIFMKMTLKETNIDQLDDIIAFRIIVKDLASCYKTHDIIRKYYDICYGRFKDYICHPKENHYQSLHTTIITKPYNRKIEIQIRSKEMHDIAEVGDANHNNYKQNKERLLENYFPDELDNILEPAHLIMGQFNGSEPLLVAYEQEIKRIVRNFTLKHAKEY